MGKLLYAGSSAVEIDDRPLAHLRVVILAKLRRGEAFAFTWEASSSGKAGKSTVWVHPAVALQFEFYGGRDPELNRTWIEALMLTANSPGGLHLVAESA